MFLTKEEVPCFLPSFTHSYQTRSSRSENVIHLKTKPAENVSARLGSAQPQHRAKNVLVPRKEGGGHTVLLRVGMGAPNCFYKQHLRLAAVTLRPISHQVLIHKYNYLENIKVIIQRIYLLLNLYCSKNTERNG